MYGTQATACLLNSYLSFENDVKMYGTQAIYSGQNSFGLFENDVKMYGTQANSRISG